MLGHWQLRCDENGQRSYERNAVVAARRQGRTGRLRRIGGWCAAPLVARATIRRHATRRTIHRRGTERLREQEHEAQEDGHDGFHGGECNGFDSGVNEMFNDASQRPVLAKKRCSTWNLPPLGHKSPQHPA